MEARRDCTGRTRSSPGFNLGPHPRWRGTWRPGDGGAEPEAAAFGGSDARAWKEEKRGWERCGEVRGWCSPFIGVGGVSGRCVLGGLTPALMALTPLKMGGLRGELRGWGNEGRVVMARRHPRRGAGGRGVAGRWWRRGRARAARGEGRS
jgi:hypothetical protein